LETIAFKVLGPSFQTKRAISFSQGPATAFSNEKGGQSSSRFCDRLFKRKGRSLAQPP
jgi:hypothetical protein